MARKCVYLDDVKHLVNDLFEAEYEPDYSSDDVDGDSPDIYLGSFAEESSFLKALNQLETVTVDDCKDEVFKPEFKCPKNCGSKNVAGALDVTGQSTEFRVRCFDCGCYKSFDSKSQALEELAEAAIKEGGR